MSIDSVDAVLHFAQTLTFKGMLPGVTLVEKGYEPRVKLTQQAMAELEQQIQRLPNLPKWFVEITGKVFLTSPTVQWAAWNLPRFFTKH